MNYIKRTFYLNSQLLVSIIILLTIPVFLSGQTVADFNSGYTDGSVISDGTAYNGLKFEVHNDRGMYYHDQSEGASGTPGLYPNTQGVGDVLWITVTKSDHSAYKFVSVWTGANYGDGTMDVYGFLDGALVDSSKSVDISSDGDDVFNFSNVDSVKFVVATDLYVLFDNFTYDTPVTPNTDPTISIDNTTLAYTENDAATQIDAAATTSDADGDADWNGGTLQIQITANAEAADEISISDTDGDGTAITISGTNIFSNGTDIGDLSASGGVVTSGTQLTITFDADATNANVQEVLQSIRYRNTSDNPGTSNRTVTFTVTDKNSANDSDTRTISVAAENDAPTVAAPMPDTTVTEDFSPINYRDLNAVFIDTENGSALTFSVASLQSKVTPSVNGADSVLVLTAVSNANGVDTVVVTASDGSLEVKDSIVLTISADNDAPTVAAPMADTTVTEDFSPINYRDLNVVFTDVESGDALAFSAVSLQSKVTPSVNGADSVLVLTAVSNAEGVDTVVVTASDGSLEVKDSVIITITGENDAPTVAVAMADTTVTEDFSPINYRDLNAVFTDVESGSALTFSAVSLQSKVTPSVNGADSVLVLTAVSDANGVDTVVVTASDGSLEVKDSLVLTITGENDAPTVAAAIADTTVTEDFSPINYRDLNVVFTDVESGDALTFSATSLQGKLTPSVNGADSVLALTAVTDADGIDTVVVTGSDGSLEVKDSVIITITGENDAPTIVTPIADTTVTEDFSPINYRDLNAVFTDVESGSALTFSVASLQGKITPSVNGTDSVLVLTAVSDANGVDTVVVTASDGSLEVKDSLILTIAAGNDAPTVAAPMADTTVTEDFATPINYRDLNAVFTDAESGDALTFSAASLQGKITPSVNGADSVLVLTAIADADGIDTVVVTASDGSLDVKDSVIVTITGENDAPAVAAPIADTTVTEDFSSINYRDLNAVFTDVESGSVLTFSVTSLQGKITPSIDGADSVLVLTAVSNVNGIDSIVVTASDGSLEIKDTAVITISAANDAPTVAIAITDTTVTEDFSNPISYRDLNSIFTDVESGSVLTFSAVSLQAKISPSVNGVDSVLVLTALADSNGVDTVVVTASDGSLEVKDSVTVTITAVNDMPTIVAAIADTTVAEDFLPITYRDLNSVFSDIESGSALTFTVASLQGRVTPSVNSTDSALILTAVADSNGIDTVVVTASDGNLEIKDSFIVTITAVNDAPSVSVAITDTTVTEDFSSISYRDLNDVFTDIESGTSLTFSVTSLQGKVTPSINSSDSVLILTSVSNANGLDTVVVTASDGSLEVKDSVVVTITAVNDAPTVTTPISDTTVTEDFSSITYRDLNGVFTDIESGSNLSFTVSSLQGKVTPSVNSANSGLILTSASNVNGLDTIVVVASDGTLEVRDTVIITITPVNDAPTIASPIADTTVAEDFASVTYRDLNGVFSDIESANALAFSVASFQGKVTPSINTSDSTLILSSISNVNGKDTVVVTASDGNLNVSDTVVITVTAVNDAPTVVTSIADTTVVEDFSTTAYRDLNSVFSDIESGTALTFSAVALQSKISPSIGTIDSVLTLTAVANVNGKDTIIVTASDGTLEVNDTIIVTISAVNDAPNVIASIADTTVSEDFSAISYRDLNSVFSDIESGSSLEFSVTSLQGVVTPSVVSTDSVLVLTSVENGNGIDTIVVTAGDGALEVSDSLEVTIVSVNDAPTITTATSQTIVEDGSLTILLSMTDGADVDNILTDASIVVESGSNYTVSGTTITPILNYAGPLTVPVKVSDGTLTSSAVNMSVTVTAVNDAPTITTVTAQTIEEDNTLTILLSMTDGTDVDNTLTNSDIVVESGSNYTVNGTTITPIENYVGPLTVPVKVTDGTLTSAAVNMRVTITAVNDTPTVLSAQEQTIIEDSTLEITLAMLNGALDIEGVPLTVVPLAGTDYTVSGTTITPTTGFVGTLSVLVAVSDGELTSKSITMTVTVLSGNTPPVLTKVIPFVMEMNKPFTITMNQVEATDSDNDDLSLLVGDGGNYSVSGTTIIPADGFTGTINVPLLVFDGKDSSNVLTAAVEVRSVGANSSPFIDSVVIPKIEKNRTLAVTIDMIDYSDEDNDDVSIIIESGENFTVSGLVIVPDSGYLGSIEIPVQVTDGIDTSNTVITEVVIYEKIIDFTSGVVLESSEQEISISPNPASRSAGELVIRTEKEQSVRLNVKIFDPVGNRIANEDAVVVDDSMFEYRWVFKNGRPISGGSYLAYFTFYDEDGNVIKQDRKMIGIAK